MLGYTDRAHSRSPTTVWDGEGFVQIQVGDIATEFSGLCQTDQCVEVGTVNVDLPARLVDFFTNLHDVGVIDAGGGWVREPGRGGKFGVFGWDLSPWVGVAG